MRAAGGYVAKDNCGAGVYEALRYFTTSARAHPPPRISLSGGHWHRGCPCRERHADKSRPCRPEYLPNKWLIAACIFSFGGASRQFVHRSVRIVPDAERIEKIAEHFLVRAQQPGLQQMTGERVAQRPAQGRLHPRKPLVRRFSFDENTAQVALIGQTLNGRLVNRFLVPLQKGERSPPPLPAACVEKVRALSSVATPLCRRNSTSIQATRSTATERRHYNFNVHPSRCAMLSASGASASIFPAKRFVM